jgi:O-antigen/teichoic acid export membrane protein
VNPRAVAARALTARVVAIGAGFLLTIVVARSLPVAEAGVFFLLYSLLAVAATLGRFGSETLALKVAGRPAVDRGEVRSLWAVTVALSTVVAALFGAVLAASGALPVPVAFATAAGAVPQALSVLAGSLLRTRGRLAAGIFAELGFLPVASTLGIAVWDLMAAPSLAATALIFTAAAVLTALWSVPLALRAVAELPLSPEVSRVHTALRRNLRPLAAMMATALLVFVVAWAPVFILSSLGMFAAVTLYTAASRLANLITLVPNVQVSLLAPRFASLYLDGRTLELNGLARRSARTATAIAAIPAVVVIAVPGWLLAVAYGDKLVDATPALVVLGAGAFLTVALGQVSSLLLLCDLEGRGFLLTLALLVAIIVLGAVLVPIAELLGIASVVAIGSVLYAVAGSLLLWRRRGVRSAAF